MASLPFKMSDLGLDFLGWPDLWQSRSDWPSCSRRPSELASLGRLELAKPGHHLARQPLALRRRP